MNIWPISGSQYRPIFAIALFFFVTDLGAQETRTKPERTGKQLFEAACAACHGADGRGAPVSTVGFDIPLPDFTDCSFASREAAEDWFAIAHEGGPVRAFDRMMPSFGEALTEDEIRRTVAHAQTFCDDDSWPRGELNLPRPLVTEKAFPEDEAVLTVQAAAEGSGALSPKFIYEKRFGPRNQIELAIPFSFAGRPQGGWIGGVGDLVFAFKRAMVHSLDKGSIFSLGGEAIFPTGNKDKGLGGGRTVFEPFALFGQILPGNGFLQLHGGFELPADRRRTDEAFWRAAVGRSFTQGPYGRMWSPMIEILGARDLEPGARNEWDLVPQVQVSLSKRQHILFNAGVRLPVTDAQPRTAQLMFYVIWDWFDGGLFSGW